MAASCLAEFLRVSDISSNTFSLITPFPPFSILHSPFSITTQIHLHCCKSPLVLKSISISAIPKSLPSAMDKPSKPPTATTKPHLYRPQPQRRNRRSCCCSLCLYLTLTLITVIFLAGIAASIVYLIYRPHRPVFTIDSLKITSINITSTKTISSKLDLTISTRNPNKKLIYIYNPIAISVFTDNLKIGDAPSIPSFRHGTKNTTILKSSISGNNGEVLDSGSEAKLRAELKNKNGLALKVQLESKVRLKFGAIKIPKVRIRVSCDGIKGNVPTGKTPSTAVTAEAKCKVDLKIKIWKWTF